ncbi:hypothetical protein CLOM_g19985 [Closterium sp. NIES-68]|nr:hypothetical protein CLOM_g19985 [Closterium sp. NIES-68]GJP67182.1 hypothetical protein CLOP_g24037 [Closterium sp. NIES-67]
MALVAATSAPVSASAGALVQRASNRRDSSTFASSLFPSSRKSLESNAVFSQQRQNAAVNKALTVRANAGDAAAAQTAAATSLMMEVDKDSFYPELEKAAAADKLVVLDMYTQWCGPCKLLAPKVEALAEEMPDVVFMKLDCNQNNKPLAKGLGVRSVPTFKLFRNLAQVDEVQGAKYDLLVEKITKHR